MKKILLLASLTFTLSAFAKICPDNKLCPGDRVINKNGYPGNISGVLPQGKYMVKFDIDTSRSYEWDVNDLAVTKGCSKQHCVGEVLYNRNGYKGSLGGYFPNGKLALKFDIEDSKYYLWDTRDLGRTTGCNSSNFCIDDVVINRNGYEGVIKALYPDGKVGVLFNIDTSKLFLWDVNDLAVTEECQFSRKMN